MSSAIESLSLLLLTAMLSILGLLSRGNRGNLEPRMLFLQMGSQILNEKTAPTTWTYCEFRWMSLGSFTRNSNDLSLKLPTLLQRLSLHPMRGARIDWSHTEESDFCHWVHGCGSADLRKTA